jgi:type I restriction enzyme R subunit
MTGFFLHNHSRSSTGSPIPPAMPEFFNTELPINVKVHNLPHWQQGDAWIFVTWRLAVSLPLTKIREWQRDRELFFKNHPEPWTDDIFKAYRKQFTDEIEEWLDRGIGECHLKNKEVRRIVSESILYFDGQRYDLDCFVIMPNHVHLLLRPLAPHKLSDIIKTMKSFSARELNKILKREGPLWQRDYYDRLIRSAKQFSWVRSYIEKNPKNFPPDTFTLYVKPL